MRQYNAWQAIFMSFYSRKLYRDVAVNWGGFAFLYLLLLVSLSVVYWTFVLQAGLNQIYVKVTDHFVEQVPVLTVKDGKISTPEKRPYLIKDANGKDVIAIIDTSGKYKSLKDSNTSVLITETEVISKPKPSQIRIDKMPANVNFVFEPVVVNEYIKGMFGWAWIIIFPMLVIVGFLYRLVQAIIYAVLGRIFSAIIGAGITYPQTLQIALVSITPVIVLSALADALNMVFSYSGVSAFSLAISVSSYSGVIGFVIGIGYLFYGVLANKR